MSDTTNINVDGVNPKKTRPPGKRWSANTWLMIAIGALLFGFGVYAAINWFQIVDDEEWVGVSGEALTNPYLALERFFAAKGINPTKINKTSNIEALTVPTPETPQVLMLGDRRLAQMNAARVAYIADWVRRGGYLIVEAEQSYLDDPLLKIWGADRRRLVWKNGQYIERNRVKKEDGEADDSVVDDDEDATTDAKQNAKPRTEPPQSDEATDNKKSSTPSPSDKQRKAAPPVRELEVDPNGQSGRSPFRANNKITPDQSASRIVLMDKTGERAAFAAKFSAYQNIYLEPEDSKTVKLAERRLLQDQIGGRIAQIRDGLGRVTIISNFDFMTLRELAEEDNAELIWYLVSDNNRIKPKLFLALKDKHASFGEWLTDHAWMVLISSLVLLALWIWRVVPRFGPLLPATSTTRRSMVEHLQAAGGFLVKHKQWDAIVTPARERFMHILRRQHPRISLMSPVDQPEYIARLTNASAADVQRVLFGQVHTLRDVLFILAGVLKLTNQLANRISSSTSS